MAVYCIGDLHGRYDLFIKILDKIEFDYEIDKLYILGDVIDVNPGAMDIFRHIFKYPNSFDMILGNHEYNFLNMTETFDKYIFEDGVKESVRLVSEVFSSKYSEIASYVLERVEKGNIKGIKQNKVIAKWLMTANNRPNGRRHKMIDAILNLVEDINYDIEKFELIIKQLTSVYSKYDSYESKCFLKEILACEISEYVKLKEYLISKVRKNSHSDTLKYDNIRFKYQGKNICLAHQISRHRASKMIIYDLPFSGIDPNVGLPHLCNPNLSNQYVIFGHKPVAAIHKEINSSFYYGFDFNYREAFSYIDRLNNHYYNLDMSDNVVVAVRLDDFEEFYVIEYKKNPKTDVCPPDNLVNERKIGYRIADIDFNEERKEKLKPIKRTIGKGFRFISYKDYCMEYLICVSKRMKEVYYKRVDYVPYGEFEVIKNVKCKMDNFEEIIEIVRDDDQVKKDSKEILSIENLLRNTVDKK